MTQPGKPNGDVQRASSYVGAGQRGVADDFVNKGFAYNREHRFNLALGPDSHMGARHRNPRAGFSGRYRGGIVSSGRGIRAEPRRLRRVAVVTRGHGAYPPHSHRRGRCIGIRLARCLHNATAPGCTQYRNLHCYRADGNPEHIPEHIPPSAVSGGRSLSRARAGAGAAERHHRFAR
ncbi:hypothetical protein GCM10027403_19070 [Arthrobacter tecti]